MSVSDEEFADLIAHAVARVDPDLENRLEGDPQAHLELVVMTRRAQEITTGLLHDSVASARSAGASWEAIGSALDMTRQAAQQRFGRRPQPVPGAEEHRQLVGMTAFNEMEQLNSWGAHGWHSVRFGPMFHDVERSDTQWEHQRAVIGSRKAKDLEAEGWERIGSSWFPWLYFKRPLEAPANPGEPL